MSWEITDHACRYCFGRVLRSTDDGIFRCAECGKEAEETHERLCWCGAEVGGERAFKCMRNPNRTAKTPQEVIVREVD
ncbi:hypothetical protein D6833_07935 [Candidatus Parcubacteria bacterium]|nr:MAG: hypothetical protein D6833_07935 [Candidatus Parcubacteria bacterium]